MNHDTKHVALVRLSAMGDVAMTVPVLLALVDQYPDVKITVVSRSFYKPIFDRIPNVSFLSAHTHHRHKGFIGIYRLYRDLKGRNVNLVADLHNVLRSKILRIFFTLSGCKGAATDKGRKEKKALTQLQTKEISPLETMIERHVHTFNKLGLSLDMSQPWLLPKRALSDQITNLLGHKQAEWIGIAPFAHYKSKTYPLDLMQKVVRILATRPSAKIILIGGGRHEKEVLDKMAEGLENVFNITKKFQFEEELQLISHLDVMLSMDSGNAHLAAMFGVKTITLWGATHPYAGFAPYNQPIENCLTSDREQYPYLPTSVYGNIKVAGYEDAMRTISVEAILEKLNKILQ